MLVVPASVLVVVLLVVVPASVLLLVLLLLVVPASVLLLELEVVVVVPPPLPVDPVPGSPLGAGQSIQKVLDFPEFWAKSILKW